MKAHFYSYKCPRRAEIFSLIHLKHWSPTLIWDTKLKADKSRLELIINIHQARKLDNHWPSSLFLIIPELRVWTSNKDI